MPAALIITAIILLAGLIWGCIRLTIWIIKTAVKEALQEYETQKHGQNEH